MGIDLNIMSAGLKQHFPEILFAYVFGSAKEGDPGPGSDLDIAVWLEDISRKALLIPEIIGKVESLYPGFDCDLLILNEAGELIAFEAMQGRKLFVREDAAEQHAAFYSLTCRMYEDTTAWMRKQLKYRGYEVQWDH